MRIRVTKKGRGDLGGAGVCGKIRRYAEGRVDRKQKQKKTKKQNEKHELMISCSAIVMGSLPSPLFFPSGSL